MATRKKAAKKKVYKRRVKEAPIIEEVPAAAEEAFGTANRDYSQLPVMNTQVYNLQVRETARGFTNQYINNSPVNKEFLHAGAMDDHIERAKYTVENAFALADAFETAFQKFCSPY